MARNGFRGAFHGLHPAQARPAQILKRNQEEVRADRALLLADAEWVEDLDHAGGVPAPLQSHSGQSGEGRAIQARVSFDLLQQPYAGDGRRRRAGRPFDLNSSWVQSCNIWDARRVVSIRAT